MVQLYDAERGTRLGEISDAQLQSLMDSLEEESRLTRTTTSPLRPSTCSRETARIPGW